MRKYFQHYIDKTEKEGIQTSIIDQVIRKTSLPTLPKINLKLIDACESHAGNPKAISELIQLDPALTFRLISTASLSGNKQLTQVGNIEKTIDLMGVDGIKKIITLAATDAVLGGTKCGSFDLELFWRHSLECAYLAKHIAEQVDFKSPEFGYLAGLLHDIGKLVLISNFPDEYNRLLIDESYSNESTFLEDKRFGIDHCKIGAWLIDQWPSFSFIADAIFYHHYALEKIANASLLVKIVYLANILAEESKEDSIRYQSAEILFGFNREQTDNCQMDSQIKLKEALHILDIESSISEGTESQLTNPSYTQNALEDQVRIVSMTSIAMQNIYKSKNTEDLIAKVKESLRILMGVGDILFFLYNHDEKALVSRYIEDNDSWGMIDQLYVPASLEESILISSLLKREPIDSFTYSRDSDLTLIDSQILHFLDKEGILSLPMLEEDEFIGTIVLGVEKNELPFIYSNANVLKTLTDQVASILKADQVRQTRLKKWQFERLESSMINTKKIVHEINNPLSIIKNYLKVLKMKLPEDNSAHDEIRIVNEEINRIGDMLRNLVVPSEKGIREREPVNINKLLSDLVRLLNGSLGKQSGIEIHLESDPSVPITFFKKDNLKQVVINLIKNAAEAMPEGGNIYIKTAYLPTPSNGVSKNPSGAGSEKVEINIRDEGQGIPAGNKLDLFDPFVTSRKGHEGLGLSIVNDLIKKMNGTLECQSYEGRGTNFKIKLPLSSG